MTNKEQSTICRNNQARQLSILADAFSVAYSILNECRDRGYFDEHPDDSDQENDLKESALTWLADFEAGGKEL